jgi:hypothetical protein
MLAIVAVAASLSLAQAVDRQVAMEAARATRESVEIQARADTILQQEKLRRSAERWSRAAIVSSVADGLMTEYAIHRCGPDGELNPAMKGRSRRIATKVVTNLIYRAVVKRLMRDGHYGGARTLSQVAVGVNGSLVGMAAVSVVRFQ